MEEILSVRNRNDFIMLILECFGVTLESKEIFSTLDDFKDAY